MPSRQNPSPRRIPKSRRHAGLTLNEQALQFLAESPDCAYTVLDIAQALDLDRATLQVTIRDLYRHGDLLREHYEGPARRVRFAYRLSAAGIQAARRIVPLSAQPAAAHLGDEPLNKTHKVLYALSLQNRETAITCRQIRDLTGLSPEDVTRILGRLGPRVSRRKDVTRGHRYFLYWLNPAQQHHFKLLSGQALARAQYPRHDARYGVDDLDVLVGEAAKRLTAIGEIEAEREKLATEVASLDKRVATLRKEVLSLRAARRYRQNELARLNRELSKGLGDNRPATPSPQIVPPVREGDGIDISSLQASQRLAFIQKLRMRPALESLPMLREIEKDYQRALTRARGTD